MIFQHDIQEKISYGKQLSRITWILKFFVIFAVVSCSSNSEKVIDGRHEYDLIGNVRSLKELSFKAVEYFGDITKGESVSSVLSGLDFELIFDTEGRVIQDSRFYMDGSLYYTLSTRYDSVGKVIEESIGYKYYVNVGSKFHGDSTFERWEYKVASDGSKDYQLLNTYDEHGRIVQTLKYRNDQSLERRSLFEYDSLKNIMTKKVYTQDEILEERFVHAYDSKGNQLQMEMYRNFFGRVSDSVKVFDDCYNGVGCLVYKEAYKYDKNDHLIFEARYGSAFDSGGGLRFKATYKCDKEGNRLLEFFYKEDGTIAKSISNKYSRSGDILRKISSSSSGEKTTYIYKYDRKGNLLKELISSSSGEKTTYIYKYDGKGNEIESSWFTTSGEIGGKTVRKYDQHNNIVSIITYDRDMLVQSKADYQYVYDDHGNFIRKIIFKDDKPHLIVERFITYY
jgi:hypothetical protein